MSSLMNYHGRRKSNSMNVVGGSQQEPPTTLKPSNLCDTGIDDGDNDADEVDSDDDDAIALVDGAPEKARDSFLVWTHHAKAPGAHKYGVKWGQGASRTNLFRERQKAFSLLTSGGQNGQKITDFFRPETPTDDTSDPLDKWMPPDAARQPLVIEAAIEQLRKWTVIGSSTVRRSAPRSDFDTIRGMAVASYLELCRSGTGRMAASVKVADIIYMKASKARCLYHLYFLLFFQYSLLLNHILNHILCF